MQRAGAALEEGDVETARGLYEECVGVCEGANAWFNLGVSLHNERSSDLEDMGREGAQDRSGDADLQVCEYHLSTSSL